MQATLSERRYRPTVSKYKGGAHDEQSRKSHHRKGYTAHRGKTTYETSPASVGVTSQKFAQVIEVPERAGNVRFYTDVGKLPAPYHHALQRVR